MEGLFLEIAKTSPMVAVMCIFWYFTRKDFKDFVSQVQKENAGREQKYQETIVCLTKDVATLEIVKEDVKEIKIKLV